MLALILIAAVLLALASVLLGAYVGGVFGLWAACNGFEVLGQIATAVIDAVADAGK